jgi:hypothetical protein
MPDKQTIQKARADKRAGKSASTQAGEFVRAEIDKIREGEHSARNTKQAIAIGLSEARRAGVDLPPPKKGRTSERTRKSARYAYAAGQGKRKTQRRPRVARAVKNVLKREPRALRALPPGTRGSLAPLRRRPLGGRTQGGAHQGRGRPLRRRQEGSAHTRAQPPLAAAYVPLRVACACR